MIINIQNASNVTVNGRHSNKNSKVVYDIDARKFYASVLDTAEALETTPSNASYALNTKGAVCKGHRLCFVSRILEYLEVINEANRVHEEEDRINTEKAAAYDAIIAERRAKEEAEEAERRRKAEAKAECERRKAKLEALQRQIEAEMELLREAELLCAE